MPMMSSAVIDRSSKVVLLAPWKLWELSLSPCSWNSLCPKDTQLLDEFGLMSNSFGFRGILLWFTKARVHKFAGLQSNFLLHTLGHESVPDVETLLKLSGAILSEKSDLATLNWFCLSPPCLMHCWSVAPTQVIVPALKKACCICSESSGAPSVVSLGLSNLSLLYLWRSKKSFLALRNSFCTLPKLKIGKWIFLHVDCEGVNCRGANYSIHL